MSEVTQVQVEEALQQYVVPHLNKNVLVAGALKSVAIDGGMVTIVIEF